MILRDHLLDSCWISNMMHVIHCVINYLLLDVYSFFSESSDFLKASWLIFWFPNSIYNEPVSGKIKLLFVEYKNSQVYFINQNQDHIWICFSFSVRNYKYYIQYYACVCVFFWHIYSMLSLRCVLVVFEITTLHCKPNLASLLYV